MKISGLDEEIIRDLLIKIMKFCLDSTIKQRGAVEACWAHNSEVGGSKPFAAIDFFLEIISFTLFFLKHHSIISKHISSSAQISILIYCVIDKS